MSKVIFVTQLIDPDDPVLGFVVGQVRALAQHCHVLVIANEVRAVPVDLGAKVVSLGKEDGRGRLFRTARYMTEVARSARSLPADALLVHMCPDYVNAAAPVTKLLGVPTLLWFAHPAYHRTLRVAERLVDVVLTSLPGAYPAPNGKVRVIGQAVDLDRFRYQPRPQRAWLEFCAIGRTSPAKGFPVVLHALAQARTASGADIRLRLVGPSTTDLERRHRRELVALVAELKLQEAVVIDDGIPHSGVTDVLAGADALVNAMVSGSGDKVVFEAMAVGRPVLASNSAFAPLLADAPLRLTFTPGSSDELAERMITLALADPETLDSVGLELRRRVEADHSLEHWVAEVTRIIDELSIHRRRPASAQP